MGFFDRFRKQPEPEIRYVPGDLSWVDAYMAEGYLPSDFEGPRGGIYARPRKRYFRTCAEAHEALGREPVTKVRLLKIGEHLYEPPQDFYLRSVYLQPKPKKPKGRK